MGSRVWSEVVLGGGEKELFLGIEESNQERTLLKLHSFSILLALFSVTAGEARASRARASAHRVPDLRARGGGRQPISHQ